jgi:hypothetical protein
MSKDSFKPLFCAPAFYTEHQDSFRIIDETLVKLNWAKTDQVMLWVSLLCLLRRPHDWFSGNNLNLPEPEAILTESEDLNFAQLAKDLKIDWPKKLSNTLTLTHFLQTVRIKPLPEVAQRAMYFIITKKYPIHVLDYEPAPEELLKIQCDGKRVITFDSDFTKWPTQMFGHRDPLSFWLHDCIHAEHFFSKPDQFISQLGFYKFIARAIRQKSWGQTFSHEFQSDFSYLIADMNSHPLHLFKTLKAVTEIHFRAQSLGIWESVIEASQGSTKELEALRKLNTAYFGNEECDTLLHMTKRLGAQSYLS